MLHGLRRAVVLVTSAMLMASCHPAKLSDTGGKAPETGPGSFAQNVSESNLTVRGTVAFPSRTVQATSTDVVSVATINMIDPSNNNTVGTATTNAAGAFTLVPNTGFNPVGGVYYILDAVKGLNTNQPGKPSVRLRTLITWDTTPNVGGWKSITNTVSTIQGGQISVRTLTTALALINAFDGARVSGSALIGKVGQVSGQWVLSSDALAPTWDDTSINALDGQINTYLTNDLDPIATINALKPTITSLDTPSVYEGQLFTITGTGFSPVPSQNTLVFNTSQALAGAQVMNPMHASATKLVFKLPTGFPIIGAGYASLIMNNQQSGWAALTTTNPPSGSGGGGSSSNPAAPKISAISVGSGIAGDALTISGTNFTTAIANNLVYFNGTAVVPNTGSAASLTVTVPAGAKSGQLYVQTKDGESNRMYFVVYGQQAVDETFATGTNEDSSSTTLGWPGYVTVPPNANTEFGSGADGVWTTSGNTAWGPAMTTLSTAAPAGANTISVGSSSGFGANTEILILRNLDGSTPANAGQYEFARINTVSGNNLLLKANIKRAYPSGVMIMKVYNYTDVTIGHQVYPGTSWNGSAGGVIAFRASNEITIKNGGNINVNDRGYRGGQGGSNWIYTGCGWYWSGGYVGEGRKGYFGWVANDTSVRTTRDFDFAGHPMTAAYWCCWGGGKTGSSGGGSHATEGFDGASYNGVSNTNEGCGGYSGGGYGAKITGGSKDDTVLNMGGGGAGSYYWNWEGSYVGANGGGILFMAAPKITIEPGGSVQANGGNGRNGSYQASGGGAGGTIFLKAVTLQVNGSLRATGGSGGSWGTAGGRPAGSTSGNGGYGRIKTVAIASVPASPSYDAIPPTDWEGKSFTTGTFPTTAFTAQSVGYDTGTTRPIFSGYSATQDLAGGSATYQFSDSADNSTWGAWTSDVTTLSKRYVRWKVALQGASTTTPPQIKGVKINYRSVVN